MSDTRPILVYQRPWNDTQIQNLANGVWPDIPNISVSEHRGQDSAGFVKSFYAYEKQLSAASEAVHLNAAVIDDVILRCRLLRELPKSRARHLVLAAEAAIEKVLDTYNPQEMLSTSVDSYILHLFVLACNRRDIRFVGLIPSFVNGHFRITALGERVPSRQSTKEQVREVATALLHSEYKPDFIVKSSKELHTKARQLWRKNFLKPVYFALHRRLFGDPLNYHEWSTEVVARKYWSLQLQDYPGQPLQSPDDVPSTLRDRSLIFLPLQMSPEATVDYWSHDTRWIDYEERVLELVEEHTERHCFLIKEHPNLLGFRTPGFYNKLKARSNVILIDPSITSNTLLDFCDGVLLSTGSVGFEAALRGIPVYSDSQPFHLPVEAIYPLENLATPIPPRGIDSDRQIELIQYLLDGLLPGAFINNGTWDAAQHDQSQMIASLSTALETTKNASKSL